MIWKGLVLFSLVAFAAEAKGQVWYRTPSVEFYSNPAPARFYASRTVITRPQATAPVYRAGRLITKNGQGFSSWRNGDEFYYNGRTPLYVFVKEDEVTFYSSRSEILARMREED